MTTKDDKSALFVANAAACCRIVPERLDQWKRLWPWWSDRCTEKTNVFDGDLPPATQHVIYLHQLSKKKKKEKKKRRRRRRKKKKATAILLAATGAKWHGLDQSDGYWWHANPRYQRGGQEDLIWFPLTIFHA